jgi:glutamate-5-semialdehyde dehydrogenase
MANQAEQNTKYAAGENSEVVLKAKQARRAANELAQIGATQRNGALLAMADALINSQDYLLVENNKDVVAAQDNGIEESLIDRLLLTPERLEGIADALHTLAREQDPVGVLLEGRTMYNGIQLKRISVPLGVVAMIYEARPNVTADAAGLCLKTANSCILRGGSMAVRSNLSMTAVLYEAGLQAGLPEFWLQSIETTDRAATNELMQLHGMIDVLIPRGSAALIKTTVQNSKVPVIETGEGNCHLYVEKSARAEIIIPILINAKTQRPGVCNAIESVLIDAEVAQRYLPSMISALFESGVKVHACKTAFDFAKQVDGADKLLVEATMEDWGREYLGLEISIKVVSGVDEAIKHINKFSTHHSESILSQDYSVVEQFLNQVDSAAVYANASTRFTDGGEFGLGAEIGISTQKLHARGPMGLSALTSSKFILEGNGQIR